jgi:hypothetical protein
MQKKGTQNKNKATPKAGKGPKPPPTEALFRSTAATRGTMAKKREAEEENDFEDNFTRKKKKGNAPMVE